MTIEVHTHITTKPLGDRIDHLLFCEILSKYAKEDVNLICGQFKDFKLLKDMLATKTVFFNQKNITADKKIKYELNIFESVKEFPKCKNIPKFKTELPKKYVTAQWDAKQTYRYISPERVKKIEKYYRKEGYEIIHVLGSGTGRASKDLDYIAWIISNADLHIGAISGGVFFSKIILPCEKIHIYSGEKKLQEKYPSGVYLSKKWSLGDVDYQTQLIIDRGAKLNYCERT